MRFRYPFRVYYDDTDAGAVMYHAQYLKYMERARTESLFELGYSVQDMADQGWLFVVHCLNIKFQQPARLGDLLWVQSQVVELKKTRFLWEQHIVDQATGTILCRAEIWVACVDKQFKVCRIPDHIVAAFQPSSSS